MSFFHQNFSCSNFSTVNRFFTISLKIFALTTNAHIVTKRNTPFAIKTSLGSYDFYNNLIDSVDKINSTLYLTLPLANLLHDNFINNECNPYNDNKKQYSLESHFSPISCYLLSSLRCYWTVTKKAEPPCFKGNPASRPNLGNPAISLRPVAFRPLLTKGLALS